MLALLALLTVGLCEADASVTGFVTQGRLGLGLGVREGAEGPVVACVIPGSAAAEADLAIGQRIVRAGGERVRSAKELEARLARAAPGSRLDLEVAHDRPLLRLGLHAIGGLLARDPETQFALLGGYGSIRAFRPELAWVVSGGYTALGAKPGTGRNVMSLRAGLEGALPWVGPLDVFAAVLVGPNFAVSGDSYWRLAPVSVVGHAGLRWGPLDVFAAGGLGPADGFGISVGVTVALGLGGDDAREEGRGPVRLL